MEEAIEKLQELLSKVHSETWVQPVAKRFIMSGIRMAIGYLKETQREQAK